MNRLIATLVALALIAAFAGLSSPFAAQQEEPLAIGKPAPTFKLPGVDGKDCDLAELLKTNKAVVVVFMSNDCPIAAAYQDRLIEIQKDYKDKGVQVVAIGSNDPQIASGDTFEGMKKRAEEKKYNFPYVRDESQDVARAYRATTTPHVFLLDAKGALAYRGAIDDSTDVKKVKEQFLRPALDSLLAGKPIEKPTTKQFGCTIKWKKK